MLKNFINSISKFVKTNGLKYTLIAAVITILLSALSFSIFEHRTFFNGIWWALVTTTTVGYGDISPQTLPGKCTAVVLMFLGIGLISSITSTTSTYFQNKIKEDAQADAEAADALKADVMVSDDEQTKQDSDDKTSHENQGKASDQATAHQIHELEDKIEKLDQKIEKLMNKLD